MTLAAGRALWRRTPRRPPSLGGPPVLVEDRRAAAGHFRGPGVLEGLPEHTRRLGGGRRARGGEGGWSRPPLLSRIQDRVDPG